MRPTGFGRLMLTLAAFAALLVLTLDLHAAKVAVRPTVPIAYGVVDMAGGLLSGTSNVSSVWSGGNGLYQVTIAGEVYDVNKYVTNVTLVNGGTNVATTGAQITSNGQVLTVTILDNSGTPVQAQFGFVVHKP